MKTGTKCWVSLKLVPIAEGGAEEAWYSPPTTNNCCCGNNLSAVGSSNVGKCMHQVRNAIVGLRTVAALHGLSSYSASLEYNLVATSMWPRHIGPNSKCNISTMSS